MRKTFISTLLTLVAVTATCCTGTGGGNATAVATDTADTAAADSGVTVTAEAAVTSAADSDGPLRLALVGDIMMGTTFPDSVDGTHLPENDGARLFDGCRHIFAGADVVCGNLEGTFLDGPGQRKPMKDPKYYYAFRTPVHYAGNLSDAGFSFMGVANNHINDFGRDGIASTLSALRDAGIGVAGLRRRCEFSVRRHGGLDVAFTQFGHSGGNLDIRDYGELRRVLSAMRDTADIVVVAFHGGAEGPDFTHVPFDDEEYLGEKRGNVVEFAHAAVDAGADVVYGHGPHVPRAAEVYRGRIIFYSLGNFCTPYRVSLAGIAGYAPVAEVRVAGDGSFLGGRIHSFVQRHGLGPQPDNACRAATLMSSLSLRDFPASPLRIRSDGTLTVTTADATDAAPGAAAE